MFKKSSMRQIRNNFVFFITRPRGAGEVENLKIPHLAVCSHKLQGIMRKIPTTIKQDSRRIHQAMFPLSIVPPRMKVSELMLKPCKARVLLDFGRFHRDSNCYWICYSKAHLGSNRSSHSRKSTPCKPKPTSNKGEHNDCKNNGKRTALCFPGGFRVPTGTSSTPARHRLCDIGKLHEKLQTVFQKTRNTHEISNLYGARCSQQAQSKYQSAQLTACTQWHCARTLRAHTARTHCARTLRADTARAHCAGKIASKIPDFADKTSDFADKTLDFATKICERSGRTVRACERTVRAYGARVRSAVPVYGGADIVYWIEYLLLYDTSRSLWSNLPHWKSWANLIHHVGRRCMANTLT